MRRRYMDKTQGVNSKKQQIVLSPAYFDAEDYLRRYEEINNFPAGPAAHFFLHGFNEGRHARFFDARWYIEQNPDVKASNYDAYRHYKESLELYPRAARFIEISSHIDQDVGISYSGWINKFDSFDSEPHKLIRQECASNKQSRNISIIAVFDKKDLENKALDALFSSIEKQYQNNFEFVFTIAGVNSTEISNEIERLKQYGIIKYIDTQEFESQAQAFLKIIQSCSYDYILKIDAGILLSPCATYNCGKKIAQTDEKLSLSYFDNDKITRNGIRDQHWFKPEANYEMFLNWNYFGPMWLASKEIFSDFLTKTQNLENLDDDYGFYCFENYGEEAIKHCAHIAFHLTDNSMDRSNIQSVKNHLARRNIIANVSSNPELEFLTKIRYDAPKDNPLISIIIPTRDRVDILKQCIDSIYNVTTYKNYEIIILDNGSIENETFEYFKLIDEQDNIKLIRIDIDFNYSKLNNIGVENAKGDYICLMNNDIEIISPDWAEEMLSFAAQADIGCVGARLWYPNKTIQHAGVFVGFCGVAGHWQRFVKQGKAGYMNRILLQQNIRAITAAVLMIEKKKYLEVHGLEEELKIAFNDVDLCLKMEAKGYKNIYTPFAQMYHHESVSRGKNDTDEKRRIESFEINYMKNKYGASLLKCRNYNDNLSYNSEFFVLNVDL